MGRLAIIIGSVCAGVWMLIKLIVFMAGKSIDWLDFAFLSSNFLLLTAISLTIFLKKRKENFKEVPRLEDIKSGIFGGMVYTVLIVLFSFFYNAKIDESVLKDKIEQRTALVAKAIESDEGWKAYTEQNKEALKYTRNQIIDRERTSAQNFLNPRVSALIYLMGLTLLTIFYAFFITLVIHKIYLPGMRKKHGSLRQNQ